LACEPVETRDKMLAKFYAARNNPMFNSLFAAELHNVLDHMGA